MVAMGSNFRIRKENDSLMFTCIYKLEPCMWLIVATAFINKMINKKMEIGGIKIMIGLKKVGSYLLALTLVLAMTWVSTLPPATISMASEIEDTEEDSEYEGDDSDYEEDDSDYEEEDEEEVDEYAVTKIEMHGDNTIPLALKEEFSLIYYVTPDDYDGDLTFTSSNPKIVWIDKEEGDVVAKGPGKATITVTAESGVTTSCVMIVKEPIIKVAKKSVSLVKGKTLSVGASVSSAAIGGKVTYSISKKSIATVNSKGVITGKKKGNAVISIKATGAKPIKVKVKVMAAKTTALKAKVK